ncbi:MAG: HIT family protein [Geobacteraceae bacterium]|nr:HIT family protein [Geobacteraceae bacterium]
MKNFTLDPRLAADCYILGEMGCCLVLLMNNSLAPWFILVPQRSETEICDLPHEDQLAVLDCINRISRFLKIRLRVDKINVAAIGNVVRQMHIHIVGRNIEDYCWPGVVWGRKERQPYDDETVENLASELAAAMPSHFFRRPLHGNP